MGKTVKDKLYCANCKVVMVSNVWRNVTKNSFVGSNETLSNLSKYMKFICSQFGGFSKRLLEVLNTIKVLKEKNKCLKENNN